jgi:hypothetical protein
MSQPSQYCQRGKNARHRYRPGKCVDCHAQSFLEERRNQCALIIVVFHNKRERITIAFHRFLLEVQCIHSQLKKWAYRSTRFFRRLFQGAEFLRHSDSTIVVGSGPHRTDSRRRNRSTANELSPAERLGRGAYESPRPNTLGPTDETVSTVAASSWPDNALLGRCVSRRRDCGLHNLCKPAAGTDGFDRW